MILIFLHATALLLIFIIFLNLLLSVHSNDLGFSAFHNFWMKFNNFQFCLLESYYVWIVFSYNILNSSVGMVNRRFSMTLFNDLCCIVVFVIESVFCFQSLILFLWDFCPEFIKIIYIFISIIFFVLTGIVSFGYFIFQV